MKGQKQVQGDTAGYSPTRKKIIGVIERHLGGRRIAEVDLNTTLLSLEFDSFERLGLVLDLEVELGVSLPDSEFTDRQITVKQFVDAAIRRAEGREL